MKLIEIIKHLEKAHKRYIDKHGGNPSVFEWDESGMLLCAHIEKEGCLSRAKKPYLLVKNKKIDDKVGR